MRIVAHRYGSICEPDYIEAFRRFGLEVEEDCDEIRRKNIPPGERVERLGRLILEHKPIFVFSINFFPYISAICQRLSVIYVALTVDCPVPEIYDVQIRNPCNRVFLFDYAQYLSVKDENPGNIFHLPLGSAVDRFDKVLGNLTGYLYDVSFVGSLYNEKDPFLKLSFPDYERGYYDALIQMQEMLPPGQTLEELVSSRDADNFKKADDSFYSSADNVESVRQIDAFIVWDYYICPHLTYRERVRLLNTAAARLAPRELHFFTRSDVSELRGVLCHTEGAETMYEMPRIFRQSKVNIHHTARAIRSGLSQRIWDVLGCGGFLLTNRQPELDMELDGKCFSVYDDPEDLSDKACYYLLHEAERETIARNGYEYVKDRHSVLMRAAEIIKRLL